ncbi:MAG: hypothetical protein HY704_17845 [Gemmatimonadetes bacterium]|nr:hypothetical protein [Gemmatimonadota bacterium]
MTRGSKDAPASVLAERRVHLQRVLGRALAPRDAASTERLPEHIRRHLVEEAEDLYWNELEWENVTAEEALDEGSLTELAFPAFLAFVDALLVTDPISDLPVEPVPRVDVVGDILRFLADRVLELRPQREPGPDGDREARAELAMATRLIDLVLYRLYGLTSEEIEQVEASGASDDGR